MSIYELDRKTRKRLYKCVDKKRLQLCMDIAKISDKAFLREAKTTLNRIDKGKLDNLADELIIMKGSKSAIASAYLTAVPASVGSLMPESFEKEEEELAQKEYDALTEEDWNRLNTYRPDYEKLDLSHDVSFEDMIQLFCARSEKKKKSDEEKRIEDLENKVKELESEKKKISEDFEKIQKKSQQNDRQYEQNEKKLNALNEELQKKLKRYENLYAEDRMSVSLSSILNHPVQGRTYRELYESLSELEKQLLQEKKLTELEDVLSAEYTVVRLMEESHD